MSLLLALTALQMTATAPPYTIRIVHPHVGGRVIREPDGGLRFGWPGTYFEGRFRGTAIRIRFETPAEHMRLLIDGQERLVSKRLPETDTIIRGLPPGEHVVRLEKQTESQTGGGRFLGFFTDGEPLPVRRRARQIEFIGDSYTVGYGNTSTTRTCPGTMVHDTTDTQQAFGPILAKRLNADYRVNAYSGFGIVRNYAGGVANSSLPAIYPRLRPDDDRNIEAGTGAWRPQLVVINLGTNDFSTPLKPGERWASETELRSAYRKRYLEFVDGLHKSYPKARFILMGSDEFIGDVQQVASSLRLSHRLPIHAVRFGELDLLACDWHPSLTDHRKLAALLEREIERLRVWQ